MSQETVAGAGAGAGGSVDSRATQRGFAAHASSLGSDAFPEFPFDDAGLPRG